MTRTLKGIVLAAALLVVLIVTLPETVAVRRWVFDLLPLIVLVACPLLHLTGHGDHARRAHAPTGGSDAAVR